MGSILPTAAARSRSMMVAVVLGTALTAGGTRAAAATRVGTSAASETETRDAVHDITRYCQACWRNARLDPDRWPDCTQQVFARLLERVPTEKWTGLLRAETDERKEFFRAIDTVKKRTQRTRRYAELTPDVADNRSWGTDPLRDQREAVQFAANAVLSPRQRRIVELSAAGWAVPDIAQELNTTPERVSDEKYKAIRKLRTHLGVDAGE
ncbi:MAG: sigma-70 family RNA polymerase sigma factor [Fimbriiglobus sp.]